METVKAPDSHPEIILERMIRENQVSLKRLCYLYLHDEAMAEDAVQETFLKAFRSLGDFRGEANEKTYLTKEFMDKAAFCAIYSPLQSDTIDICFTYNYEIGSERINNGEWRYGMSLLAHYTTRFGIIMVCLSRHFV